MRPASLITTPAHVIDAFHFMRSIGINMKLSSTMMCSGDIVKVDFTMHPPDQIGGFIPDVLSNVKGGDPADIYLTDLLVANLHTEVHICMESKLQPNPPMVRVTVKHPCNGEPGSVHVLSVDLDRELHDLQLRDVYWDPADLPEWLHDRLVKLMVMPLPPPPLSIEDIGQRISNNVFWVYIPKEL